jgi:putative transposase
MIADRESADLATRVIEETCTKQRIKPGQLTVHADRGSSMMSKPLVLLMEDLGNRKCHSRPRVSNDNPVSESQFKTKKCRPDYPGRFGSLQDARSWAASFFTWYNKSLSQWDRPAVTCHRSLREGGISSDQASASAGRCLRCPTGTVR